MTTASTASSFSALATIRARALGVAAVAERMSSDERLKNPTKLFGENYNTMVRELRAVLPDLAEAVPPEVDFIDNYGSFECRQPVFEIWTFCSQIASLISCIQETRQHEQR